MRIQNCGYGNIEKVASKARICGGWVSQINGQTVVATRIGDTLNMIAEKWAYSNKYGTFGVMLWLLQAESIEINNIEFISDSLAGAFKTPYDGAQSSLKTIKIINSDMSYIKDLSEFCAGKQVTKIEILGTTLDSVTDMHSAFSFSGRTGETLELNIPKVPRLNNACDLFAHYNGKELPDLSF